MSTIQQISDADIKKEFQKNANLRDYALIEFAHDYAIRDLCTQFNFVAWEGDEGNGLGPARIVMFKDTNSGYHYFGFETDDGQVPYIKTYVTDEAELQSAYDSLATSLSLKAKDISWSAPTIRL